MNNRVYEVRYYESCTNDKGELFEKVVKDEIKAKYLRMEGRMAIFSEDMPSQLIVAAYPHFVSIKRIS